MKKSIIFIIVTLVLGLSGYLLVVSTSKPVINTSLSKRAEEYIHTQKTKANDQWSTVDLSTNASNQKFQDSAVTNDCFTLRVPFSVLKNKFNGKCSQYIT